MALVDCPECGKPISSEAYTCPKCGYPTERHKKAQGGWKRAIGLWFALIVLFLLTWQLISPR
ncbi:MAG: zinc-ribbon domain-containing protein [Myxococcales bacterium]|nr:zinc-ribbon domain-containing protein [Myxococcales bacterium]